MGKSMPSKLRRKAKRQERADRLAAIQVEYRLLTGKPMGKWGQSINNIQPALDELHWEKLRRQ